MWRWLRPQHLRIRIRERGSGERLGGHREGLGALLGGEFGAILASRSARRVVRDVIDEAQAELSQVLPRPRGADSSRAAFPWAGKRL